MPKKKSEEESVETTAEVTEEMETAAEETKVEARPETETEEKSKKSGGKKKAEATDETDESSIIDSVVSTVASAVETVAEVLSEGVANVVSAVTGSSSEADAAGEKNSKRAEKIGIVSSDKMTKTVTVRVDRVVKHPIYRKYIKRRKKFMAHDETGASIGDKVRIIETRPLSAKKRWRVVEIIQKAEK
jgi:small subunit ribosomal protein S17